ncbi:MAG: DNA translocase FtsK [Lachnospiraceae bacterium]|jgi:S-DNA-T family DNA segregation ATPase FtsK/SpoIIIE|nr:DNA translocase FtsK [Lachnospiraceae bacterium]
MASGTSGRRRTSTKKRTTAASRKAAAKKREETAFIRDEVLILVLFAVSVLLLISNFGIGGALGGFISGVMFGLFGILAYLLPVGLFLIAAFSISNRENTIATVKAVAAGVAFFLLCAVAQLVSGEKGGAGTAKAFYSYCAEHRTGGGFFGGMLCKGLTGAFGTVGTWLLLLVLLIICVVVITEKSFISGVKTGGKKVYDTAREDARRHRALADERREARRKALLEQEAQEEEEKKQSRMERKISGVALEGTTIKKDTYTDEMREITVSSEPDLKDLDEMFELPIQRQREGFAETDAGPEEEEKEKEKAASEPVFAPEPVQEDYEEEWEEEPEDEAKILDFPGSSGQSDSVGTVRRVEPVSQSLGQGTPGKALQGAGGDKRRLRKQSYQYPPLKLLRQVKNTENRDADRILQETAIHLQQILRDFGVGVTVTNVSQGPSVTRYELQPDQGVKVSKIVSLADDIKLNLAVADVRIEAPIPGKAAVGIEVPNAENAIVSFRELVASQEFKNHKSRIAFAVGKDIAGKIMVTDIAKMPHLLIAGATGSGKSVCINTLIMSILYKADPEEVKLIMVDPKVVELSVYNGIPHLFIPVVTDPKKAAGALNWAVAEMTNRYKLFADYNVRNLQGYNEKIKAIEGISDENKPKKLPQIVIVVDELADLMMVAPGEVEDAICRLAQLARAAGIHLIIATQRPSVNVITGLIKANMPSRIAFAVSSGVDSRTILDMNGAEKLLGKGDMLFYPYGYPKPVRVQGAFVSDEEVGAVVEFLKKNNEEAVYSDEVEEHMNTVQAAASADGSSSGEGPERDALFAEAGKFIIEKDKASIGMLQRWFKVGFNRAARIMDQLAEAGVVGEEAGTKPREILMTMEEFEQYIEECV